MRRLARLIFVASLLTGMAGCWSQRNIREQAFVMGLGFDTPPKGSSPGVTDLMTVQIAVTSSYGQDGGGDAEPVHVTSALGIGTSDANLNMAKQVTRALYYGHTQAVIFGQEKARQGLRESLDVLERAAAFRRSVSVFIAEKKALDILKVQPKLEQIGASTLPRLAGKPTVSSFSVPMGEFISLVYSNHAEAAIPVVSTIPEEGEGIEPPKKEAGPAGGKAQGGSGAAGGAAPGGKSEEPPKRLKMEGIALFRSTRMVAILKDEEADGFLLCTNRYKNHLMSFRSERFGVLQANIYQAKSGISTTGPIDKPRLKVEISVGAVFWEVSKPKDFLKLKVQEEIERELAKAVKRRVIRAIRACQKYKADAIGFNGSSYRRDPKQWRQVFKRWGDIFAGADVEVVVKARLMGTGSIMRPARQF